MMASAVAVLVVFWTGTRYSHIDFTIYREAVHGVLTHDGGLYGYREPRTGLGFTYPPFAALLLGPLAMLPERFALDLWLVLSLAMSIAFCRTVLSLLPARLLPWDRNLLVAPMLWSVPVVLTLRLGQINALIALLVLTDVVLALAGRRPTGYLTGVAAALKLTPLAMALFFVGIRRTDTLWRMASGFAFCTVVAVWWRPDTSREYWTHAIFETGRVGTLNHGYNNSLWRLVAPLAPHEPGLALTGGALVLLICLATVAGVGWAHRTGRLPLAVLVGGIAPSVLSPITWAHHLYFLLLLPIVVWSEPWLQEHRASRATLTTICLALVLEVGDPGQHPASADLRAVVMTVLITGVGVAATIGAGPDPSAPSAGWDT
jgi:alpha-1,2-mannosyltransferase